MALERHADSLFGPAQQDVPESGPVIEVAFDTGADISFSYRVPQELWPLKVGQRVEAPFGKGNRLHTGFCVARTPSARRK